MKKYFFDVTDIVTYLENSATISGIQRVTTMIINNVVDHLGDGDIYLSYYDEKAGDYVATPLTNLSPTTQVDMPFIAKVFLPDIPKAPKGIYPLQKYQPNSPKYHFHRLKLSFHAALNDEKYFVKRGFTLKEWQTWRLEDGKQQQAEQIHSEDVKLRKLTDIFQSGDVLCILGPLWGTPKKDVKLAEYSKRGLDIFVLVHDVVPLLLPATVAIDPVVFFTGLETSTGYCRGYIANSECTASDLRNFLDALGCATEISTIPLAQDRITAREVTAKNPSPEQGKQSAAEVFEFVKTVRRLRHDIRTIIKLPYVLCVGTMEARKNCWRIAQAWQQLAARQDINLPRLVFAGRRGWLNDDFFDAMDKTGGLGGWVQFVDAPSDSELEYLYQNCEFTIMASLYEGWGLPIGESLSYGKTGVVSNTSSMPEVGGDLVEYCDPHSISSIASACETLIVEPKRRQALEDRIAKATLRQWSDVSRELAEVISGKSLS
ncbi:MAG: glycosyl transferase family 1 [Blastopirellula sp.]|nr:MAG: glycosyl transferase family 1 [Blastopirellula sp.]